MKVEEYPELVAQLKQQASPDGRKNFLKKRWPGVFVAYLNRIGPQEEFHAYI